MSYDNYRFKGGSMHELMNALHTLSLVHTRDDRQVGFTVETTPHLLDMRERSEYVEMWRIVRDALGYQTAPGQIEEPALAAAQDEKITSTQ